MKKEYEIREYLKGRNLKECYNGKIREVTFETEMEKTTELLINNETVYCYNELVIMIELDESKSKHGWKENSYKVKGKKRPYITAQKEKFYLDELEIVENRLKEITVYGEETRQYTIGEITAFKRK